MILCSLHELRRSEDGQALVLGAIFGLVLMLCVLGTVNLGRAVYDKVQLQAAADAAAYSQAAVEARVLNFTAYTNRAMVVHYASIMAATTYLSYLHFQWVFLKALLNIAQFIPGIGGAFAALQQVLTALVTLLDVAVTALVPMLAATNLVLYALQEGAWFSVWSRLGSGLPDEAHSGDSAAHPYVPIWPRLLPLANQAVFAQTRGHLSVPQDAAETARILVNHDSKEVQQARLHMLDVANSARQPWVAYGDGTGDASISPLARHFELHLIPGHLWFGTRARTELGSFKPGTKGSTQTQVWSGEQMYMHYDFRVSGVGFKGTKGILTFAAMDQLEASVSPFEDSYFATWSPGWALRGGLDAIAPGLTVFFKVLDACAKGAQPRPDKRLFALSPYVYFAPRAKAKAGPGPTGEPGNFGQPDVLVGLAKEGHDFDAEPGAAKGYGRRFSWDGGKAGKTSVDFAYTDKDWPKLPGVPANLQLLHRGFNAFAAAQVYYHRPGDWKEMPNFFNPLWGARLMPVTESSVAAKLGLTAVPLLRQLLMH